MDNHILNLKNSLFYTYIERQVDRVYSVTNVTLNILVLNFTLNYFIILTIIYKLCIFMGAMWCFDIFVYYACANQGKHIQLFKHWSFSLFFLFLQFWDLNSGHTPWATPPAIFLWWIFWDSSQAIYPGWLLSSWSLPPE
jgi:hypothetical protein